MSNVAKLYRIRGNEVDVLLVPIATRHDGHFRPAGGMGRGDAEKLAIDQGFRFKRDLTPAEWRRIRAMRASGVERGPMPPSEPVDPVA